MKNATQCEKQLKSLVKKIGPIDPPEIPDTDDPIAVLVMSFLMWESTTAKAVAAYRKIMENIVDLNDLRVTMPHEIESWIGARYPRALDRAQRLRATLRDVYLREHAVTLESLSKTGKREVRRYIETLDGIVPYVAARLMLLAYDIHAVPADDQLRIEMVDAGAADVTAEVPELISWLSRQVKATEGTATHYALQHWMDGRHGTRRKAPAKKPAAKKTTSKKSPTKKTTSKKTPTKKPTTKKSTAKKSPAKKTSKKAATKKTSAASKKKTTKKK